MDNIISGAIAVAIFLAFVLGLAQSIGELPFVLIVVIVSAMICTDFFQSAKQSVKEERQKKSNAAQ